MYSMLYFLHSKNGLRKKTELYFVRIQNKKSPSWSSKKSTTSLKCLVRIIQFCDKCVTKSNKYSTLSQIISKLIFITFLVMFLYIRVFLSFLKKKHVSLFYFLACIDASLITRFQYIFVVVGHFKTSLKSSLALS